MNEILKRVALEVGADPQDLHALIQFESGWDPLARNPVSGNRGLIQFGRSAAQRLGYLNPDQLVFRNPTVRTQLEGPVKEYLQFYSPFRSQQALFMSVFYPEAMNWNPNRQFPDIVKRNNPGIATPADYTRKVTGQRVAGSLVTAGVVFAALLLFGGFAYGK